MRYADPALCPDCRSDLPRGATTCGTCGLVVRHDVAVELFRTLQHADALVSRLRSLSHAGTAAAREPVAAGSRAGGPSAAAVPPGAWSPAGGITRALPPAPVPAPLPRPERSGVRFASVPKILLGLGALCVLVAAVIFLAVSWSYLGVGGRTAVLVGLTVGAAGSSLWLNRHELRVAAESLMVVALGLLTLDLLGAESAGWLGDPSPGTMTMLVGALLAVAGTLAALPAPDGRPRLAGPQVAAALGLLVLYRGALDVAGHELVVGHVVVSAGIAVAWLVRDVLRVQAWSLAVVATVAWGLTAVLALADALDAPSLKTLWLDGAGWSLLASAVALLAPGRVTGRPRLVVLGGAGAALIASVVGTVPSIDEGARFLGLVALGVTAGWVAVQRALPPTLRPVATVPAGLGSLLLLVTTGATALVAGVRVLELGAPFTRPAAIRLSGADALTEPLLAVPSVLVLVAFVAVTTGRPIGAAPRVAVAAVLAGAAGVVTLASYDVPLASVVAALALLALATTALGLAGPARSDLLAAAGLLASATAVAAALPSATLTTVAAAVVTSSCAAAHLRSRTEDLRIAGGVGLPVGLGLAVWAGGSTVDHAPEALGVPVLLAVGLLAIARPRPSIEASAGAVGACATLVAVAADLGSLALHLTVAGALLCATALVHRSRRELAYVGGGLLFLATWVRLGEVGVTDPEPYTLPLAVTLAVVGLVHLRRHPDAATATALLPGLLLATMPSLLWVLADPVSLRALILGFACLALAVAGAALRWSAPLTVGAAVGAAVVLRELGPYAGDAPQWLWIGLAGALLITVGITWEQRLLELRRAVGLVGRLR
ncbi:MAG TPA: hypothetical protein VD859_08065 [Nocardioides sp.]|nr:hypothetical protein [Nocardioides sp.]